MPPPFLPQLRSENRDTVTRNGRVGRAADVADNVKATGGLGRGANRFPCVQKFILKEWGWVASLHLVVAHLNRNFSLSNSTIGG